MRFWTWNEQKLHLKTHEETKVVSFNYLTVSGIFRSLVIVRHTAVTFDVCATGVMHPAFLARQVAAWKLTGE